MIIKIVDKPCFVISRTSIFFDSFVLILFSFQEINSIHSVCKFTKILNSPKQIRRKIAQMHPKTPNASEKNLSSPRRLAIAATYPSPAMRPLPCASLPYGLHLGVLAWYILRQKNKIYAGPLMGRAYLFNRATGGAVASLP